MKKENDETKLLNNMQKIQFLKLKNSLSESKDQRIKRREMKIIREIEELFLKPIIIDDMGKFDRKEMKKKKPIKNTWYNWLINYTLKPISQTAVGCKDKVSKSF